MAKISRDLQRKIDLAQKEAQKNRPSQREEINLTERLNYVANISYPEVPNNLTFIDTNCLTPSKGIRTSHMNTGSRRSKICFDEGRRISGELTYVDIFLQNPNSVFSDATAEEFIVGLRRGDREKLTSNRIFLERIIGENIDKSLNYENSIIHALKQNYKNVETFKYEAERESIIDTYIDAVVKGDQNLQKVAEFRYLLNMTVEGASKIEKINGTISDNISIDSYIVAIAHMSTMKTGKKAYIVTRDGDLLREDGIYQRLAGNKKKEGNNGRMYDRMDEIADILEEDEEMMALLGDEDIIDVDIKYVSKLKNPETQRLFAEYMILDRLGEARDVEIVDYTKYMVNRSNGEAVINYK